MRKVYIVGACRTPIGKLGGVLSEISATDLGAIVIKEAVKRAGLPLGFIEHVYMGCVIQAGLGQNIARQASLKAGLPYTTTAETLNMVCGSGLSSVNSAARLIQTGEADVVIAGGTESMSKAPFAMMKARYGYRMGSPMVKSDIVDTMINDALWDAENNYHMGITAENLAKQWHITRQEMDIFAMKSQKKAYTAIQNGAFKAEIVPVKIESKKNEVFIDMDESPRTGVTMETLSKLNPVFMGNGTVTAGNASGISDGAAAVVLISEDKMKELKLKPMAEWLGGALGGVNPAVMGTGPIESTNKLLNKLNMSMNNIDLIEVNEAFAVQSLVVADELHILEERLNVNGGAIALGHPVGASGCRILVTLLYEMQRRNVKTGLATLCIGGGMGCSTMVQRG